MKRRLLAGLLSFALLAGVSPVSAAAETSENRGIAAAGQEATDSTDSESVSETTDSAEIADQSINETDGDTLSSGSGTSADSTNDIETSDTSDESEIDANGTADTSESGDDAEERESDKELILPDPGIVTGFPMMDAEDITIRLDSRVSYEELQELMPETILVYLDNSTEAVEIPVTWVSENDYETTRSTYYIFWADWDKETYPLVDGYGIEEYLPFVEVILPEPLRLMSTTLSSGVSNIVARARQVVDIRWTPIQTLNGFSDDTTQLTVYSQGVTYNGIPYGQQVYSGKWVPHSESFDTFLDAVKTAGSLMYTSRGNGGGTMDSTYYGNDCSSYVAYCYALPRMTTRSFAASSLFSQVSGNSIYNAEVGDCFNLAGAHIEIITGLEYDDAGNLTAVEVCEQTPPKARTVIYTPEQAQTLISGDGYTLLRYTNRNSVSAPVSYSGYDSDKENPVKVHYSTEEASEVYVTDRNGDGTVYDIQAEGLEYYNDRTAYRAAVWSQENGQDDLQWITLSRQTDGSWTASFEGSSLKHAGSCYLHLYKMGPLGNVCVHAMAFSTISNTVSAEVYADSVTVDQFNNAAGTCRVLISGVSSASGVKTVQVPIWSASGQADIIWYTAKKLDSTTWYVDLDISKHNNNYGTYQIHVYGTNKQNNRNFCGSTTVTFKKMEPSVYVSVNGTEAAITAENLSLAGGIRSILIPTWSRTGGQDDIRWENASWNSSANTAAVTIDAEDYKHYGEFISHIYAKDSSGNLHYLTNVSYTIEEPVYTANEISSAFDETTGDFTVKIAHPKTDDGSATAVQIPIWSGKSQSDIIWYKAKKSGSTWTVTGNISSHAGLGTYYCHVYGTINGKLTYLGQTGFTAATANTGIKTGDTEDGISYPVTITGLKSPVALKRVQAAVWSANNGQDDIVWYTLKNGSTGKLAAGEEADFTGSIDIRKHKTAGSYYVHLYGVTTAGKNVFLGSTTMDVSNTASVSFTVTDETAEDGKISLVIEVQDNNWSYSGMKVPVWSTSNQSDIYWYTAEALDGDTWTVEVDNSKHKNNTGNFHIHTYLEYDNGIFGYVGSTRAEVA